MGKYAEDLSMYDTALTDVEWGRRQERADTPLTWRTDHYNDEVRAAVGLHLP